jgi:hypothetical protein
MILLYFSIMTKERVVRLYGLSPVCNLRFSSAKLYQHQRCTLSQLNHVDINISDIFKFRKAMHANSQISFDTFVLHFKSI